MTDTKTLALVAEVERLTKELAEAKRDAERYRYILDCDVQSALKYLPDLDVEHYKATRRANADKAMRRAGANSGWLRSPAPANRT